jgi:choline dehydrogenase-like flavoprotein
MSGERDSDVIVVGAGAGGAAAAYGLCRRGRSVLLLDAGPRFDLDRLSADRERLGLPAISAKAW